MKALEPPIFNLEGLKWYLPRFGNTIPNSGRLTGAIQQTNPHKVVLFVTH